MKRFASHPLTKGILTQETLRHGAATSTLQPSPTFYFYIDYNIITFLPSLISFQTLPCTPFCSPSNLWVLPINSYCVQICICYTCGFLNRTYWVSVLLICVFSWLIIWHWTTVGVLFLGRTTAPAPSFPQLPIDLRVRLRPPTYASASLLVLSMFSSCLGSHVGRHYNWSSFWHY